MDSESSASDKEAESESESFKSISSGDDEDDFNPFRDESSEDNEDGECCFSIENKVYVCTVQDFFFLLFIWTHHQRSDSNYLLQLCKSTSNISVLVLDKCSISQKLKIKSLVFTQITSSINQNCINSLD